VKLAPVEYLAAQSVDGAAGALAADDGAKVIAGGQSLVPLMAMRLARPTLLVDINGLGLAGIALAGGLVRLGALVRQRALELDPVVASNAPLLHEAAMLIGYPAIRNRGTIGGSLAHADPAAELPAALVAAGGSVVAAGPGGSREIAAADLFDGVFTTTLSPDELIVEVRVPTGVGAGTGAAFCEWTPREFDFAEAGVALHLVVDADGRCVSAGSAACGVGPQPVALHSAFSVVLGESGPNDGLLRAVASGVSALCRGASGDRSELAGLLAARALRLAFHRAIGDRAS
jgi:carbon-monoxide dehydrogenase medium subunit